VFFNYNTSLAWQLFVKIVEKVQAWECSILIKEVLPEKDGRKEPSQP